MIKYGIYFAYWEKYWAADYRKYVSRVKELGFDTLEISCGGLKNMSDSECLELKKLAADEGVMLTAGYGPRADENLASSDPAVVENAIRFFTGMLKKLELMEIHTIGGGLYSYWPVDFSRPVDKEADWARSVKNVRTVAHIAGECGVNYCLEVLNRYEGYLLNTAEEGVRFVEQVDEPAVKVMLDTFHMNIEEDSMVAAIETAGKHLGHFHVGENNRRVPGKGNFAWNEIGGALRRIHYDGSVVMEPFVLNGGEVGQEIRVWRDLSRNADQARLDADARQSVAFLRHAFSGPYSDYTL